MKASLIYGMFILRKIVKIINLINLFKKTNFRQNEIIGFYLKLLKKL